MGKLWLVKPRYFKRITSVRSDIDHTHHGYNRKWHHRGWFCKETDGTKYNVLSDVLHISNEHDTFWADDIRIKIVHFFSNVIYFIFKLYLYLERFSQKFEKSTTVEYFRMKGFRFSLFRIKIYLKPALKIVILKLSYYANVIFVYDRLHGLQWKPATAYNWRNPWQFFPKQHHYSLSNTEEER